MRGAGWKAPPRDIEAATVGQAGIDAVRCRIAVARLCQGRFYPDEAAAAAHRPA
jgi:hypothetical protein